jgi:hypothetical protein
MKATRYIGGFRGIELLAVLLLKLALPAAGQTGGMPVVTIRATDPFASESGHTGTFTLFRDGPTNQTLTVFYGIGGTASNGVDYVTIPFRTIIPAGLRTATITVTPIDDTLVEGTETVELDLTKYLVLPPVNYSIGSPSNAVVYIADNDGSNVPPIVSILTPTNGSKFTAPANINICAEAHDPDGQVMQVEFFENGTSIGVRTNCLPCANPANSFCVAWSGVGQGAYDLTAVATDDGGASTTSAPVHITVGPGTTSNLPPVVRIISPANGATFRAPVNIPIYAYSRDPDGKVVSVEFFADTNSLGFGRTLSNTVATANGSYFFLVWSNAPLGVYPLTAKSTDNGGAVSTSDVVRVTILPTLPPPTNRPAVVSIVATDPMAIEGTNCWPWVGSTNTSPTWTNWMGTAVGCRFYTNCGPKSATFTVRRDGSTSNALTVTYAIGGTASNGVDYVMLPGSVTIPAGDRRALITVVPIDDGPPDVTSTVILRLLPSTDTPLDYVLGYPRNAAAIVLDGRFPRPVAEALRDRCFHLSANGPDGAWFGIEYSNDLQNWVPICNNQVIQGSIDFIDPDAQSQASRLYRAVPLSGPPPE